MSSTKQTIKLFKQVTIKDADGKVVRRSRKTLSRSFVRQFLDMMCGMMAHDDGVAGDVIGLKDTSNASVNCFMLSSRSQAYTFAAKGGAGSTSCGIVVGTGTNAVANSDYALQTLIAHGTGAGQLQYGAMTINAAAIVGGNVDLVMTRVFTNGSAGTVTINELGIYIRHMMSDNNGHTVCIVRDLETHAVNSGQTATVTYTFRTTA